MHDLQGPDQNTAVVIKIVVQKTQEAPFFGSKVQVGQSGPVVQIKAHMTKNWSKAQSLEQDQAEEQEEQAFKRNQFRSPLVIYARQSAGFVSLPATACGPICSATQS